MSSSEFRIDRPCSPGQGFFGLVVPVVGRVDLRWYPVTRACLVAAGEDGERGWPRPVKWVDRVGGQRFAWCGELRELAELPENRAAFTITARLGQADLADRIGLRGDLLLAGIDSDGAPIDVPDAVVQAAVRSGLLTVREGDPRSCVPASHGLGRSAAEAT
jgi:hypothetical protein